MSLRHLKSRISGRFHGRRSLDADLQRARNIAEWLDTKFEVGGIRFGLEGLLGLVPVAGDALGTVAGMYPLWVANRHKLGKGVQARMILNLLIEFGAGTIPWVGDAIDVAFKANIRNARLLEKAVHEHRQQAAANN